MYLYFTREQADALAKALDQNALKMLCGVANPPDVAAPAADGTSSETAAPAAASPTPAEGSAPAAAPASTAPATTTNTSSATAAPANGGTPLPVKQPAK